ncbi:MAG: serine protease [Chloroflexi bacterium]|nr:serine protease [Chloroflexota bacterium]
MPTPIKHAALGLGALLCVLLLAACEQAAEWIPDPPPATPAPEGTGTATASPTPIIVNPDGSVGSSGAAAQVIPDHELALSVVQVIVIDTSAGFEQVIRSGTGVVVNAEAGLIATSYPVVAAHRADGTRAYTSIVIATGREPGTEPEREFVAELASAEPSLYLAVLRITGRTDGGAVGDLDLLAARLGAATSAGAGFSLRLFGYPGLPGDGSQLAQVVQTAQATITGQRGSVARTGRTWFKIDARMPFGAAGGPAFDRFGGLIGILAQDRYIPTAGVAQVRPLDLLSPLVAEALRATRPYEPPLYRTATLPGSLVAPPASTVYISRPAFAENALEGSGGRDLFDYETRFVDGLGALYYEYEVNGLPNDAIIEERWFLNGVQQASLSSSFIWSQRDFGYVSDRITAPSPAGMPSGRWRLDVYVEGALHATGTAIVGVPVGTPEATYQFAASAATAEGNIGAGAFSGAAQLLMMFDLSGMSGATNIEWHVFRDNQPTYTSPPVRWEHGEAGRFWIGYAPPGGIGPGTWEFELHAGGNIIGVGTISLF